MSPEEFDNRLRSTFKDENLPPREHLWQNINDRLEAAPGSSTIWYWVAPALILVVSGIAWLTNSIVNNEKNDIAVVTNSAPSSTPNDVNLAPGSDAEQYAPTEDKTADKTAVSESDRLQYQKDIANASQTVPNQHNRNQISQHINRSSIGGENPLLNAESSFGQSGNSNPLMNTLSNDVTNEIRRQNNLAARNIEESLLGSNKLRFFNRFNYMIDPFSMERIQFEKVARKTVGTSAPSPIKNTRALEAGNFESSRHWINFGIGANSAFNSFKGYMDPTYTVHKDLWSNREKLTNKGGGFNTFLTYQNKFALKNRLSYEVGFSYTSHSEDIKMNEYSKYIAYRHNDTIVQYQRLKLWTIMPGGDTNYFDLETPFVLVTKNRYSLFTMPFRINYEQPLTEHTFLSIGLGGGLSYIYTKKATHLDLVKETERTIYKKGQFNSSINGMMSLYTNFNSLGQLGVYCGYQMQIGAFKLNEQYGIHMSDLQYGLTFRRPLFINKKS